MSRTHLTRVAVPLLGIAISLAALPAALALPADLSLRDTFDQARLGLQPSTPRLALERAWTRARAAGSFRFDTDSTQTLIPRPSAWTIGHREERLKLVANGAVIQPDRATMAWTLSDSRGGSTVVTTLRDGQRTFRQEGDTLTLVADPGALTAPDGDPLGYLAAAGQVTRLEDHHTAAGTMARYAFTLDGPRYARYLRDRLTAALAGELPPDIRLAPPPVYDALRGDGELWVDPDGLPRRLVISFELAEITADYDAAVRMQSDFRDYGQVKDIPRAVETTDGTWRVGAAGISGGETPRWLAEIGKVLPSFVGLALCALAGVWVLFHRRRRLVYATVVVAVCGSMVAGPVLRAVGLASFQARRASAAENGHGPLASIGASADPAAVGPVGPIPPEVAELRQTRAAAMESLTPAQDTGAGYSPERKCVGTNSATVDTDTDGLSDLFEGCLGTDPHEVDTDQDLINDRQEVTGIQDRHGQTWYSDPLRPDSDGDGLLDRSEWPTPHGAAPSLDVDGDGLPNFWDEDSDGDGVLDGGDYSPYAATTFAPTFGLDMLRASGDYTDTNAYQIVRIQVQPENLAHLRYGLTPLDWPPDQRGQIQNLSPENRDVRLQPMLAVKTNLSPSMAFRYGVSVEKNSDSDKGTYPYRMYVPLSAVNDGGAVTAFLGGLAYTPAEAANVQWESQLVWMAQGKLDRWKNCVSGEAQNAQNCSGYDSQDGMIQMYADGNFRVTGILVEKSKNDQIAVIGTPDSPDDDMFLFQLMLGLNATYLVSSTQTLAGWVQTLENPATPPNQKFGITTTLEVEYSGDDPVRDRYAYSDIAWAQTTQTTTVNVLNAHYKHTDTPSLLYAFQEETGTAQLEDMTVTGGSGGVTASLDIGKVTTLTQRGVKLAMYQWEANYWAALPYSSAVDVATSRLPSLTEQETLIISLLYAAFTSGQTNVVTIDGKEVANAPGEAVDANSNLPNQSWFTLATWTNRFAQLAGMGEKDSAAVAVQKLGAYVTDSFPKAAMGAVVAVSILALVVLNVLALAVKDPAEQKKLQLAATVINDVVAVLDNGAILISKIGSFFNSAETSIDEVMIELKELGPSQGGLPEEFEVGDEFGDIDSLATVSEAADDAMSLSDVLGVVGLVLNVAIILISLFVFIGEHPHDGLAIGLAVAYAVAALVVTVLLFLITLIPVVGEVILAVIIILDLLVEFITWLFTGHAFDFIGWLIGELAKFFYDVDVLVKVDTQSSGGFASRLDNTAAGIVGGAGYVAQAIITTSLTTDSGGSWDDVTKSSAYGEWDGSKTTDATYVSGAAHEPPMAPSCVNGDCYAGVAARYTLKTMRDAELRITQKLNYRLRILKRVFRFIKWHSYTSGTAPTSSDDLEKATNSFYLDVMPQTLDGFWSWPDIYNFDTDADGLSNAQESTIGTDPDKWDSDGDGLSDGFELESEKTVNGTLQGADPLAFDTDGDGLSDRLEIRYSTSPNLADTDGDGLTDNEEICRFVYNTATKSWTQSGGWLARIPGGSLPTVRVCSNPNDRDADADGIPDGQERTDQTSPVAYNLQVPLLVTQASPFANGPNGRSGVYVAPGDAVGIGLTLISSGVKPITQTLDLCLPGNLTGLRATQAPPTASTPGACPPAPNGPRFQWTYSPQSPLPQGAELDVVIGGQADPALQTSRSGSVNATLPYSKTVLTSTARIVVDADVPTVTITDPPAGTALRSRVGPGEPPATYNIGGTSGDATSWVTQVGVDLGQNLPAGSWTRVLTSSVKLDRWATTWTLPAQDGTYTLAAQATDFTRHASTVASRSVMIDNTPPAATFNHAENSWLTGLVFDDSGGATATLGGTATDNLSGLARVDLSIDGRPWESVALSPATPFPTQATWTYSWRLPSAAAQGSHVLRLRAFDKAGNELSPPLSTTVLVDLLAPGAALATYTSGLPSDAPFTMRGHVDDTALLPPAPHPQPLLGSVDTIEDATVWLGLPDAAPGSIQVTWLGDVNGDGRDDAAIGMPGTSGASGKVAIVYGQAGGWTVPMNLQDVESSGTSFLGAPGANLGATIAAAGDANGDGFDDLLVGDPANNRVFLVYGLPAPMGTAIPLSGPGGGRTMFTAPAGQSLGQWIASAGDVNGDGLADLLLGAAGTVGRLYLVLGRIGQPDALDVSTVPGAALPLDKAGAPALGAGDTDGDGYDEFLVADPNNSYGATGRNTPAVYLWNGRQVTQLLGSPPAAVTLAPSQAQASYTGSAPLAASLARLGDADGDGKDDFAFSSGAGPVLVSSRNGTSQVLNGIGQPAYLAGVGDVNADGLGDLVVGLGGETARLYLGVKGSFPASPAAAATLGQVLRVAAAPFLAGADCNCDGSSDLLAVPAASALSALPQTFAHPPRPREGTLRTTRGTEAGQAHPLPALPGALLAADGPGGRGSGWLHGLLPQSARPAAAPAVAFVSPNYCPGCDNDGHTWGVDAYTSIQAAVATGAPRVLLAPGIYRQTVNLASNQSVVGSGAESTILAPPATAANGPLVRGASGLTGAVLSRVTLAGQSTAEGLSLAAGAQLTLQRSVVRQTTTAAALAGSGAKLTLVNNTFVGNTRGVAAAQCASVDMRNTILAYHNGAAASYNTQGCPAQLNRYNVYWQNMPDLVVGGSPRDPSGVGQGQVLANPLFTSMSNNEFELQPQSPAIDAGDVSDPAPPGSSSRVDIGYVQYGQASFYANTTYCGSCPNDGLEWQVDAFTRIGEALAAAEASLPAYGCSTTSAAVGGCAPALSIVVGPGTYAESLTLPANVHLLGSGADNTTLQGAGAGPVVNIQDVVGARLNGFRLTGWGTGATDAAIQVAGASSQITLTRNLIAGTTTQGSAAAIRVKDTASAAVYNNTLVGAATGIEANGTAARVVAQNNIVANNNYGLYTTSSTATGAQIYSNHNLLFGNTRNYAASNGTQITGASDITGRDPLFVNASQGNYHLQPGSPAIGTADPDIAAALGSPTDDLGYAGALAVPVALLFGQEGPTCATANSGVQQVQVGLAYAASPSTPLTATVPSSWTTAALSTTGQTGSFWSTRLSTSGQQGLIRLFTQTTDRAGNTDMRLQASYIADGTPPAVAWLAPAGGGTVNAASVGLSATANDWVNIGSGPEFSISAAFFLVDGVRVDGAWVDDGWSPVGGQPRTFQATVPLETGSHTLVAGAIDGAGHVTTTPPRTLTVAGSDVATLSLPLDGSAVRSATVPVQGFARFAGASRQVTLYVDGQAVGPATVADPTQTSSAFHGQVTLSGTTAHTIQAVAGGGSLAAAAAITVRLDTTAPTLSVTAPAPSAVAMEAVTFRGTADDGGSGLALVEVSVDGGYQWSATLMTPTVGAPTPWSLRWQPPDGSDFARFPAQVRALDRAGNATVSSVTLVADNEPPEELPGLAVSWCAAGGQCTALPEGGSGAIPGELSISWKPPIFDGSGPATAVLTANVDGSQAPAPTDLTPVTGSFYKKVFLSTADQGVYFLHLGAKDRVGNIVLATYGPYYIGVTPPTMLRLPVLPVLSQHDAPDGTVHATFPALDRPSQSQPAQNAAPTVAFDGPASRTVRTGRRQVTGSARDASGAGVVRVEVRPVGASAWSPARGTLAWSANVQVPAAGTLSLEARAVDGEGLASPIARGTFLVDNVPPQVAFQLPARLEGTSTMLRGTAFDPFPTGGLMRQVQLQIDDGTWRHAERETNDNGSFEWRYAWRFPNTGEQSHRVRVRAIDAAGNVGQPTAWQETRVVPPLRTNLSVTQLAPSVAAPGGALTYQSTVRNSSATAASDVTLVQMLPAETTLVSAAPACPLQNGALVCQVGRLAPGAVYRLEVVLQLSAQPTAKQLTSIVTVRSREDDSDPSDNRSQAITRIDPGVLLPYLVQGAP